MNDYNAIIKESLKKSDFQLFLVARRSHYIDLGDKRVNTGLYNVSEILCTDNDSAMAAIHNFYHNIKDDENALLTDKEAYAYFYCNQLNQKIVDEMDYEFRSSESFDKMKEGPFEDMVYQMVSTMSKITFEN